MWKFYELFFFFFFFFFFFRCDFKWPALAQDIYREKWSNCSFHPKSKNFTEIISYSCKFVQNIVLAFDSFIVFSCEQTRFERKIFQCCELKVYNMKNPIGQQSRSRGLLALYIWRVLKHTWNWSAVEHLQLRYFSFIQY